MGLDFVLLASSAPLDIVCDLLVHLWPLVEFFDFPDHFISSGVSCCGVIVDFL
jgi:hypothetical protein